MDLLRLLVDAIRPLPQVATFVALTPPNCIDRRSDSREKHPRGKAKGRRAWTKIVGLTWHQTASGQLHATHPKLLGCPVHILVHRDGTWTWLHDFDDIVWHGHALNGGTIGIEIDCRGAGVEGDARTFWRSKADIKAGRTHPDLVREATDAQLAAIPQIMRFCCERVAAHGGKVRANWTHRQGHKSRTSDPGSRIWRAVKAAEAAAPELDLQDVSLLALGSGRAVDPRWS